MIRYLRHSVHKNRKNFNKSENLDYKIFLNVSTEFSNKLKEVFSEKNIGSGYFYYTNPVTYHEYIIWYSYDYKTFWTENIDIEKLSIKELEQTVFTAFSFDNNHRAVNGTAELYRRLQNLKGDVESKRENREIRFKQLVESENKYLDSLHLLSKFNSNIKKLKKLSFDTDGRVLFKFQNVVAEDTDAEGGDIELGDLTFATTLGGVVTIVDGSYSHSTEYNSNAYHPHHLSSSICLGSQSSDFISAIVNFQFDIVGAILYKFAHSYTSSDSAGMYWKKWAGLDMDEDEDNNMVYVSTRDNEYDEIDCRYSNYRGEWLHEDDARFSEYLDDYLYEKEAVYSNYHSSWMSYDDVVEVGDDWRLTDDCVILQNGDWRLTDDCVILQNGDWELEENTEIYNDEYYLKSDFVSDINGDDIPESLAVFSNNRDAYILREDAVEYNGDWYPEGEVPTEETNVEDTQQPQDITE